MRSSQTSSRRFAVLDGWRALSILLVMSAHMLPLGPKFLQLNGVAASLGMAMFFALSGFLIMHALLQNHSIFEFFVRRLFRIVPLAVVYIVVIGLVTQQTTRFWITHLLFVENYVPTDPLGTDPGAPFTVHFWSLCVEMHFYLLIGAWMGLTRFRAMWIVPVALVSVTLAKFAAGQFGTALTHWRIDEILAGAVVALLCHGHFPRMSARLKSASPLAILAVLAATCHPVLTDLGFECLRPYAALALIANVIMNADRPEFAILRCRPARYIADISFALYVLHPFSLYGWLGHGESKVIIYLKRPICFALTWAVAHLSTNYLEAPMIRFGKSIIAQHRQRVGGVPTQAA